MRKWLWLLVLFAVPAIHAQVTSPSVTYVGTAPSGACSPFPPIQVVISTGVPYTCNNGTWASAGGGGGSGFPITLGTTSIASGSTTTAINGLSTLQKQIYLNTSSEIGAQCNAAVTALGATGGIIWLPNSTSLTMTTTCTNIPAQISIQGYGKNASIVNCSVAGDCFQFVMDPVAHGEVGGVIAGFSIYSSNGAAGQVLMHTFGMGGFVLHDLQFQPFNVTSNTAVCLEFDGSAGTFTEGNTSWNITFERACAPGVLFVGAGGTSFGYNTFQFKGASTGANWLVQFNGTGYLYNSTLQVMCNHVATGAGGGCIQFNGGFGTASVNGGTTNLFVSAEEDGTGTGTVLAATGTNSLGFVGQINNGYVGGGALSSTTAIGGSATYNLYSPSGSTGISPTGFTQPMITDIDNGTESGTINRAMLCPNLTAVGSCGLVVGHDLATNGDQGLIGFSYVGLGNTGNRFGLSMYGGFGFYVDTTGNGYLNGGNLNMTIPSAGISGGLQINENAQTNGKTWNDYIQAGVRIFADVTDSTTPAMLVGVPSTFANLAGYSSMTTLGWNANSQFVNSSLTLDTGFSRDAADAVDCGNGTQGNKTCTLNVGKINVLAARKGTFVCTAGGTITISNTNGVANSDILITMNAAGGTITTPPAMKTITAGTGFTVLCGASDTSTYNYDIIN